MQLLVPLTKSLRAAVPVHRATTGGDKEPTPGAPKEVRSAPYTQTGLADFIGAAPDAIIQDEEPKPEMPRAPKAYVHRRYPERRNRQGGVPRLVVPLT